MRDPRDPWRHVSTSFDKNEFVGLRIQSSSICQRVEEFRVRKKISVFEGTLKEYLMQNPQVAGTFDSIICLHSLTFMASTQFMGELIQIALKKDGRMAFMDTVPAEPSHTGLRAIQRLCRAPSILFFGYDVWKDVGVMLSTLQWKLYKEERFTETAFPLMFFPHIMGYAIAKEGKGGLHVDNKEILERTMRDLRTRTRHHES
ncbi:hypothetical protein AAMO2058_001536000 [Amorphochlora amoebiformis]